MTSLKRVFLTGGRGMVGRNILEHAHVGYFEIFAPTRQELDLTNAQATYDWVQKNKPDIVIHAAGLVGGIQANIARPVDFLVANTEMARNVILASRQAGITRLLNLASSCMYPRDTTQALTEDMILTGELEPTNEGYAIAKVFATRLCQYIRRESPALEYKTLVPCNLYGRYDSFAPEHSHLVPAVIHKIHCAKENDEASVEIWGDGTARREFMYAGDLADAVIKAIQDFSSMPDVMNVGLGHDFTVNEYYETAARVIGWKGHFLHNTNRPVGMRRKLTDVQRLRSWGWLAQTTLEEGISQAYAYYLKERAI